MCIYFFNIVMAKNSILHMNSYKFHGLEQVNYLSQAPTFSLIYSLFSLQSLWMWPDLQKRKRIFANPIKDLLKKIYLCVS